MKCVWWWRRDAGVELDNSSFSVCLCAVVRPCAVVWRYARRISPDLRGQIWWLVVMLVLGMVLRRMEPQVTSCGVAIYSANKVRGYPMFSRDAVFLRSEERRVGKECRL